MSKLLFARRLLAVCSKWESLSSCRQWSNIGSAADRELIACQSRILPGPERIRVSAIESSKDECKSKVTTVYEAILLGRTLNDNKKAFGYWSQGLTELRWISYDELLEKCQQFGSGLLGLGQEPEKSIVTVNCRGSLEYAVSHYSLSMFSMTSCPITANADKDAIAFVLGQVESSVMVCDTIEKAEFLLSCRDKFPSLRMLILVEDPTRDIVSACRSKGLEVLSWKECLERGKKAVREPIPPKPEMLYAIVYTSGTTGMPKGVPLTHQGLITTAHAVNHQAGPMKPKPNHICFSFLPTGHIYEHIYQVTLLLCGATLGFYRGDVKALLQDMQEVKPTNLPMVPRLLNRVYYKVHSEVQKNPLKNFVFKLAVKQKRKLLKKGITTTDTIWDKFVFKKIRDQLGGNIRYCVTTSAPAAAEVLNFFRIVFGCLIVEVYGSTEVSVVTSTLPYDFDGDHVGCLFDGVELKLIDVPEMNYFAKDDRGEICVRSPMTFKGYYKNPEATAAAITPDGWVLTGDIGTWTSKGTLKVIDRKRDFFKLSQGEFISPERIESVYSMLDYIAAILVDGWSTQDFTIAIVVPQEEPIRELAALCKIDKKASFADLCSNKEIRKALLAEMQALGNANGLNSLHQVQNLHLHPETNLLESGLVTSTLKLKRNCARELFKEVIRDLYDEGPLLGSSRNL